MKWRNTRDRGRNKKVREEMVELFGDECWIDKLDLKPRSIIGDYVGRSIKCLKKDRVLVYHHIIMKKDGGKNTIANGALLSEENHTWLHQQKQWRQDTINQYLQMYKINFILANFNDELAVKATKLQIDYDELDEPNYFIIGYDEELDKLDTEIFKEAKKKKEKDFDDR